MDQKEIYTQALFEELSQDLWLDYEEEMKRVSIPKLPPGPTLFGYDLNDVDSPFALILSVTLSGSLIFLFGLIIEKVMFKKIEISKRKRESPANSADAQNE